MSATILIRYLPFMAAVITGNDVQFYNINSVSSKFLHMVVTYRQDSTLKTVTAKNNQFNYSATKVSDTQYNYKISGLVVFDTTIPANTTINIFVDIYGELNVEPYFVKFFEAEIIGITTSNDVNAIYVSFNINVLTYSEIIKLIDYIEQKSFTAKVCAVTDIGTLECASKTRVTFDTYQFSIGGIFDYLPNANYRFTNFRIVDASTNTTVTEIPTTVSYYVSLLDFQLANRIRNSVYLLRTIIAQ